jgi:hypothetical protein
MLTRVDIVVVSTPAVGSSSVVRDAARARFPLARRLRAAHAMSSSSAAWRVVAFASSSRARARDPDRARVAPAAHPRRLSSAASRRDDAASASASASFDWRRAFASASAGAYLAASVAGLGLGLASPPSARASFLDEVQEPSPMGLKLKPRESEIILETKAEHINEDFSHSDLVGAIYTEGDLRGSDFSGSDLRAAIFSRAIMPGVNFEGSDMQNAFLDYVVLRGSNFRGVVATGANFVRSDLGDCDVTDADFSEAVIDRYQNIQLCETASGTNPVTGVDTRQSLMCDQMKRYEGFNKGNDKVAVAKSSGTWGGGK